MADAELRDQIARLKSDIEQLAEALERCRKAMLLSKVAIFQPEEFAYCVISSHQSGLVPRF